MKDFRKWVLFLSLLCLMGTCAVYGMDQKGDDRDEGRTFLGGVTKTRPKKRSKIKKIKEEEIIKDKKENIDPPLSEDSDKFPGFYEFDKGEGNPEKDSDLANRKKNDKAMLEKDQISKKKNDLLNAVITRKSETIKKLMSKDAENASLLNQVLDDKGNTALHIAAQNGFHLGVKTLLELKADFTKKNGAGLTPLQVVENELKNTKIEYNQKKQFYWVSKFLEKAAAENQAKK